MNGRPAAFLDGPGGTQVPDSVIEAMTRKLAASMSNVGGPFPASSESEQVVEEARSAAADLFNARGSHEVMFGQSMTSLTFTAARAVSATWHEGDEIVVTRLDHDANVQGWVAAAQSRGVTVRFADFDPSRGCVLPAENITSQLTDRTRLVAVTRASNALGTIVDVAAVTAAAHEVGALVYVDAVHYAPHGPIDVQEIGCDFLAASAYKFYGPHVGLLYGREEVLLDLDPVRVRHGHTHPAEIWETGTLSFESLAGVTAAIDYLASLGDGSDRRGSLRSAIGRIADYERGLSDRFLAGLPEMPGVGLYGPPTSDRRAPTFALDIDGITAAEASSALGRAGIFTWHGHYYAVEVMQRLGFLDTGGLLRIGFVHYTTGEEVDRVLDALDRLAAGSHEL